MSRRVRRIPRSTSPTSPTSPASPTGSAAGDVEALQIMLAAEHAAVYVYAVLGARTSESAAATLFDAIRSAYVEHRDRRDVLIGTIAATGAEPAGSAAAYEVPGAPGVDLGTPEGVTAVAAQLEAGCTATYATGVGSSTGSTREQAIGWVQTTAVRGLTFGGAPEDFPGLNP